MTDREMIHAKQKSTLYEPLQRNKYALYMYYIDVMWTDLSQLLRGVEAYGARTCQVLSAELGSWPIL